MARHKLENELIAIEVEEHGAELKSLVRKNTGKEYMWKADPKFWGRTSPVLFPFVGAVKEKQFGIMSKRDPQYASAEFGNEIYEAAVKKILDKVENWKRHPEEYLCHGMCLD